MIKDKIIRETIFENLNVISQDDVFRMLQCVCKELDLSCPVLLPNHVKHIKEFKRYSFLPSDFIESVDFTKFEIELYK